MHEDSAAVAMATQSMLSVLIDSSIVHQTWPGGNPDEHYLRSSLDFGVLRVFPYRGTTVVAVAAGLATEVALTPETRRLINVWNSNLTLRSLCLLENGDATTGTLFLRSWAPMALLRDDHWSAGGQAVLELVRTTIFAPSELAGGVQSERGEIDGYALDLARVGGRRCTLDDVLAGSALVQP